MGNSDSDDGSIIQMLSSASADYRRIELFICHTFHSFYLFYLCIYLKTKKLKIVCVLESGCIVWSRNAMKLCDEKCDFIVGWLWFWGKEIGTTQCEMKICNIYVVRQCCKARSCSLVLQGVWHGLSLRFFSLGCKETPTNTQLPVKSWCSKHKRNGIRSSWIAEYALNTQNASIDPYSPSFPSLKHWFASTKWAITAITHTQTNYAIS